VTLPERILKHQRSVMQDRGRKWWIKELHKYIPDSEAGIVQSV
jgi:hypothetical protein